MEDSLNKINDSIGDLVQFEESLNISNIQSVIDMFESIKKMGFVNECIDFKDEETKKLFMKVCLEGATKEEELILHSELLDNTSQINEGDFSLSNFISECFKSGQKYAELLSKDK